MTPKPTSPVTSTRAGDEMIQADELRSYLSLREEFVSGKPHWRIVRLYPEQRIVLADFGDDRLKAETAFKRADGSFQADSIASEKVCDHPSTEKAGFALVPLIPTERMIEVGCDNNPTQWNEGTPNGFAAEVANDVYVSMVRTAASLIANPANLHGSEPESSEPSLLGRETVREALEKIANADAMFPWARQVARRALASLSPLKE